MVEQAILEYFIDIGCGEPTNLSRIIIHGRGASAQGIKLCERILLTDPGIDSRLYFGAKAFERGCGSLVAADKIAQVIAAAGETAFRDA